VLQKKLRSLSNVEIITQAQVKEIFGQQKMEGLIYENRETKETHRVELAGIFIQIGLQPNTQIFQNTVETNRYGEILINERNHTNVPGIFAAGDCSQTPFKQIVTAMGSGATAGLSAFEFLSINE
jgi:alkyl hydroperoxide reductase subunit F